MANLQTSTVHPSVVDTPSTSGGYYHDVFISHRGPDLKNTFASHAYHRLLSHGLQPFFDREALGKGESLLPQIEGAIRTASAHIVMFSPGYVESRWCLHELSLICKSGATIIPVFYNVKPSEFRWTGRYAQALTVHEQKGRCDRGTLEDWRKALKDVSEIIGFELEAYNRDEGKLLDDLVKCVLKKVRRTSLAVATYPTGLKEKVAEFEKILSLQEGQSGKVKVMGIVGMGGIGKTTLAKALFNKKSSYFGESCFLFEVRENASKGSLKSLQAKLIKDLVHIEVPIDHIDEGTEVLKTFLKTSPHALVVIDDVDRADQLNVFRPLMDVLSSDSLILVTSRSKNVFTSSGLVPSSIYRMTRLNGQHSQQLFCSHAFPDPGSYAFSDPHSPSEFKELVDEFCRACDGLPLSLKVIGDLLCRNRDKSYWEELLKKLRQIKLPNEVQETLRLSYDALEDDEKQIFLDTACYFIGEDRDMAIRIWDGSGWNGLVGLANLQDRCLVEVNTEYNTIEMHHHLRDLGRKIAESCGVIPHGEWPVMDIPELWRQYSVISEVRGIRTVHRLKKYYELLDEEVSAEESSWLKSWCEEVCGNCLRKSNDPSPSPNLFSKLQLVATEGDDLKSILRRVESPNLIWLRWSDCPYNCLPHWLLTLMRNVRVLEVSGKKLDTLWRAKSQAPRELRELTIHSSNPRKFEFPKSIGQLKHLEKIVVNSHGLEVLPKEFCDLRSLKYLDLSGSRSLGYMEEFSDSQRLQILPDSFGCLANLQHLNLSYSGLQTLPDSFGCLTNLVHLDLSASHSLQILPNSFGNLIRLKYLNLQKCSGLTISDETFANVRSLEYLNLSHVRMEMLPRQVTHQQSLEELHLPFTGLVELPEDIRNLMNLEVFYVGSHSWKELPCSLGRLSRLKHLELFGCTELKSLPDSLGWLTQLSELKVYNCGIESLSLVEGVCPSLKHISVLYCNDLLEVGALPPTLVKLYVRDCHKLRKMEGLYNLTHLQQLDIEGCKMLEELPCLESLTLKTISLKGCKVRKMEGLYNLTNLQNLYIKECKELEELEGLYNLKNLHTLHISQCKELEELPCLNRLISLKKITLFRCDKVRKMEGLHNLTNLQELDIRGCKELEELPCVERLISLKKIEVDMCCKLKRIEGLGQLTQLQECSVVVYDAPKEIDVDEYVEIDVKIVDEYRKCAICRKYLSTSDNYTDNHREHRGFNRWREVHRGFMSCTSTRIDWL